MTEFITRNYGQKEFEVIIKTDSKDHYKQAEEFSRKLIGHAKPQTNADRIRAMSDDELAEFLIDLADDGNLRIRDWLQQPAENVEPQCRRGGQA